MENHRPKRNVSVEVATEIALAAAAELRTKCDRPPSQLDLWAASGRSLAQDIRADQDQPPFDRSAMDGFACRSADLADGPARLQIVGESAAGAAYDGEVNPGEAAAIMTGAQIPAGADTVQIIENASVDGDFVTLEGGISAGQNIRYRGENVREGDIVVPAGRRADGLTVGVLASVGATQVLASPAPRVTVISSGSELVGAKQTPGPGEIRDSNRHMLLSLLADEGASIVDGGNVADERLLLAQAIRAGLESDVLIISGGVSAGKYDLVAETLAGEGVETLFHKATMKPGKPILFGRTDDALVFGLPGNPVSTYVTALLFVLPTLRILSGRAPGPWRTDAILRGELSATARRTTFHPGFVTMDPDGGCTVEAISWKGSADQFSYARANALIRRDAGAPAATNGAHVDVVFPTMPFR